MKKRLWAKLKGRAGESIGETLVALLIGMLALTMLAGTITSATRLVTQSKDAMSEYYEKNNAIARRETKTGTLVVSVTIQGSEVSEQYEGIPYYVNDKLKDMPVAAYAYKGE